MNREELLRNVAPCGLVCYTCGGCDYGVLKECSKKLVNHLDGITDFLGKDTPSAKNIEAGYPMLEFFMDFNCPGCRDENHNCQIENCVYRECTKSKQIDFCAECDDFPCNKPQLIPYEWEGANTRIREVGIERFFEEEKIKPHYAHFKKEADA